MRPISPAGCSIRNSRFTLVNAGRMGENWELFDLQADPGETKNILAEHPEVVKELKEHRPRVVVPTTEPAVAPGLVSTAPV